MKKISNRTKTINSVVKSKLDWKQYKTKEKIEQQLDQKRKSGQGVLEKAKFIEKTQEKERLMRRCKQ